MRPLRRRQNLTTELLEARHLLSSVPFAITTIGDSVSSGLSQADADRLGVPARAGYRPALWDKMNAEFENPGFEFVGASDYNPTNLPQQAIGHSTHRGFATYSFFPFEPSPNIGSDPNGAVNNNDLNADGWATFDIDAALIMVGVNDVFEGRPTSIIEDALRDIINELRIDNNSVDILLGTLAPFDETRPNFDSIPVVNDMIVDLVNADPADSWIGSTVESTIHIVDHYNGQPGQPAFDLGIHTVDGVHPNAQGDELLASNWWSVLEPIVAEAVGVIPPVEEPPVEEPPVEEPPVEEPPVEEPPVEEPPVEEPPVEEPPVEEPPVEEPPVEEPPVEEPPAEEPPVEDPPVEEPPVEEPPVEEPPVEEPPAEEPPVEDPPAEEPPVEDPPVEEPPSGRRDRNDPPPAEEPPVREPPQAAKPVRPNELSIAARSETVKEGARTGFILSRTGDITEAMRVHYRLSGTATQGSDFVLRQAVTIPAGESEAVIQVQTIDDDRVEGRETVTMSLLGSDSYLLHDMRTATTTIVDNDQPVPKVSVSVSRRNVRESESAVFTFVRRSNDLSKKLELDVTIGGTAKHSDYETFKKRVIIPAGSNSVAVRVKIKDDDKREGDETIIVKINESKEYRVDIGKAQLTILRNDQPPKVSVSVSKHNVRESESAVFTFVRKSDDLSKKLELDVSTRGTAKHSDYETSKKRVVIPAGSDSVDIRVKIKNDDKREGDETIVVKINESKKYQVDSGKAQLTILENDQPKPKGALRWLGEFVEKWKERDDSDSRGVAGWFGQDADHSDDHDDDDDDD